MNEKRLIHMNEIENKLIRFLSNKSEECEREEQRLIKEERKDEANLYKIKANIYNIYAVLYQTAKKQVLTKDRTIEECQQQIHEYFLEKASRIPLNWKESYVKAKEHQDVEKILIEETKLAVANEIMLTYQQIRGEA